MTHMIIKIAIKQMHNAISQSLKRSIVSLRLYCKMSNDYSVIVYKSLDSVLEHLNKPEFKALPGVTRLLEIYNEVNNENADLTGKKYPLIVLEGLDGCGKSTATKRLSSTLDAILFCTPPPCIKVIRDEFDSSEYKDVRTAYYSLGNYIAAMQLKSMLQTRPVVLDRFWHSTAAYAIAQTIADDSTYELPKENDPIYEWPTDLLQPDIIAFLCVNEQVRLQRLKNRTALTDQENLLQSQQQFRNNVVKVYNNITPKMKFINGQLSKRKTEEQILKHVESLIP